LTGAYRPGQQCCRIAGCWALIGAVGCGYLFLSSTRPITITGEPPLLGPAWLQTGVFLGAILLCLPWVIVPLVLLVPGLIHVYRGRSRRTRWQAAWTALMALSIALEAALITGFGVPFPAPNYQGPAIVGWVELPESVGFLVVGVSMMALLGSLRREPG
jgi:hypothetical protein